MPLVLITVNVFDPAAKFIYPRYIFFFSHESFRQLFCACARLVCLASLPDGAACSQSAQILVELGQLLYTVH